MKATGQDGFTLVELMTAVGLTAVLAGALFGLGADARRDATTASARADELSGFRAALRLLSQDLRAARAVEHDSAGNVRIETDAGPRTWRCAGDELVRNADRRDVVVARAVTGLDVSSDGAVIAVRLHVGERTVLSTAVLPRAGVER